MHVLTQGSDTFTAQFSLSRMALSERPLCSLHGGNSPWTFIQPEATPHQGQGVGPQELLAFTTIHIK